MTVAINYIVMGLPDAEKNDNHKFSFV